MHIGALINEFRKESIKGYCSHPQASKHTCSRRIIRSHTIQRRGGLTAIAENGHVISPKLGFEDIFKNEGKIIPREHGVKGASTFMGFCEFHDSSMFRPVESGAAVINVETAFLLSFRALSYELFTKRSAIRAVEVQREMDRGKPFDIQCAIQEFLNVQRHGLERGLKDLEGWKLEYDESFRKQRYNIYSFCGVAFSDALPVVACGAFHPEFDFEANSLQKLGRGDMRFDHMTYNLTTINGVTVAVLGWTGDKDGPSEQFARSFMNLPSDQKANAAVYLAFEHLENVYMRPSWWNGCSNNIKSHLVQRFRSGIGIAGVKRRADCLSKSNYDIAFSRVDQEFSTLD